MEKPILVKRKEPITKVAPTRSDLIEVGYPENLDNRKRLDLIVRAKFQMGTGERAENLASFIDGFLADKNDIDELLRGIHAALKSNQPFEWNDEEFALELRTGSTNITLERMSDYEKEFVKVFYYTSDEMITALEDLNAALAIDPKSLK